MIAVGSQHAEFDDEYTINAHLSKKLSIRYTNKPDVADLIIAKFDWWLQKERYKVVGIDFEYTIARHGNWWVAITQLCMGEHFLLYHFCRANKHYSKLSEFLRNRRYTFATVGVSDEVLMKSDLHVPTLVDIQAHYRITGSNKKPWEKDTLEDLSATIICPSYKGLHKSTNKQSLNRTWEEPLSREHIAYAARNTYTSYSMYRHICAMRDCLLPPAEEESAHSSRSAHGSSRCTGKHGRKL